ncbi:MAG: VOC family protein [Erythrobacter sp.]
MAALGHPVRQIAWFVPDIVAAAHAHHAAFGSGPFFVFEHVPLSWSEHRGVAVRHDHSSAYGQWGEVMVEFVMQHGDDPSAFHDMFPVGSGAQGLHHMAIWVDDLETAIAHLARQSMPLAQLSQTATGTRYAFVDATNSLGHMLELYEPTEALTGFYAFVREAAQGWDGTDPIRHLS